MYGFIEMSSSNIRGVWFSSGIRADSRIGMREKESAVERRWRVDVTKDKGKAPWIGQVDESKETNEGQKRKVAQGNSVKDIGLVLSAEEERRGNLVGDGGTCQVHTAGMEQDQDSILVTRHEKERGKDRVGRRVGEGPLFFRNGNSRDEIQVRAAHSANKGSMSIGVQILRVGQANREVEGTMNFVSAINHNASLQERREVDEALVDGRP
ncbi:hypothetical protein Acr_15g0012190 [Actinidia rufa]|uniref:Uncharacterized protein n=1 Tax=Actinidia rufa TaxID=165716 RepID=A0A7J0FVA0_9ERIC|nr:hypothetical protein Acr_15g0012190 [Actinidia rufa]